MVALPARHKADHPSRAGTKVQQERNLSDINKVVKEKCNYTQGRIKLFGAPRQ